jgi:hypothetical protein
MNLTRSLRRVLEERSAREAVCGRRGAGSPKRGLRVSVTVQLNGLFIRVQAPSEEDFVRQLRGPHLST